ncbi:hypothetical protein [Aeromonas caviae]|uniref:hypothetical protein n=1 Tax=Aeromonas caviae TaxID=648 RepID=UPI001CD76E8C|nr:hypothetical protein [Aeromonas caviae]UBS67461.1 hypothetical protein LCG53_10865 [Aeromonas caviae]HEJ2711088.1 hypothetical protein [Pseudomonas aeruginosa]HEJ2774752.1 hypothetical protein [Pseudomonas aeruginosa]
MNGVKTLTAIVVMTAAFSVNAGYRMQIPIETANGGALPDGTIVFVGLNEPSEPVAESPLFSISVHLDESSPNCLIGTAWNEQQVINQFYGDCSDMSPRFTIEIPQNAHTANVGRISVGSRSCIPDEVNNFYDESLGNNWISFNCSGGDVVSASDYGNNVSVEFWK